MTGLIDTTSHPQELTDLPIPRQRVPTIVELALASMWPYGSECYRLPFGEPDHPSSHCIPMGIGGTGPHLVVSFLARSGHQLINASAKILASPHPIVLRFEHGTNFGHLRGFKKTGIIMQSRKGRGGYFIYRD